MKITIDVVNDNVVSCTQTDDGHAEADDTRDYVILRGYRSGVHAGYLVERTPTELVLEEDRRLWHWEGAASLSELAVYGPRPDLVAQCKFGAQIPRNEIARDDVSEIIHCTPEGRDAIREVPSWRA